MNKPKIEREKETVRKMVALYCRKYERNETLCPGCLALTAYACERLDNCKSGAAKPSCRKCTVHCYKASMRTKIKQVMRFSGPRMLFYEPWTVLRHLTDFSDGPF